MPLIDELEQELDVEQPKKRHRRSKEELIAAGYYNGKEKPDVAPDKKTRQSRNYAAEVAGLLMPLNELIKAVPLTTNDALTQEELERAIIAGNLAAKRYPRFRTILKQAEMVTLAGAVISLVVSIGLRVADNHNLLPESMQQALKGQFTRMQEAAQQVHEPYASEAGYTPASGYNGNSGMPTVAQVFPPR